MTQPSNGVRAVRKPWRGLIWQLLLITILPLAALTIVIAFGSQSIHQRAMRQMVGERDARAVRTAAGALEEQLRHRQDAMLGLAVQAENSSPKQLEKIVAESGYLLDDFNAGLAIFDSTGGLNNLNGSSRLWSSLAGQLQPAFDQLAMQEERVLVSTDLSDPETGEKLVLVLAASPDRKWVAAGAATAAEFVRHSLGSSFVSGHDASVVVVDANNNVLYQIGPSTSLQDPAGHVGVAGALHGESGIAYRQAADSEHVLTYSPIKPFGWALVLEEPWEMVGTPTLRTTQLAPLVLAPVLALTLLALWFGLHWIIKPLQELEARAATVAWGDFNAIEGPVGGIGEIRQLQAELILMARKVKAAQQSLHSYIGAITAGQEDERRRLARELHDETIQSLIALKQRVQLAQLAAKNGSLEQPLSELITLTEQAIDNVRRQMRALRPIYLEDLGLVTALEMLARETSQAIQIPVAFQRHGAEQRLEPDIELALYRMAQEALNNISRHSRASQASLSITFNPGEVVMQVSDDGRGFEVPKSPAEFAPAGHFGLLGLYERAELIGARLEIQSAPGQGCRVSVYLRLLQQG